MSLRARIMLAVCLLVGTTAILSWLVSARVVLKPFAHAVGEGMALQAIYIASELEGDARARRLERALGVEIEVVPTPPHGRHRLMRGRRVWRTKGTVTVESELGLLEVRRALDPERPARRLPLLLFIPTALLVLLALWLAVRTVGPLEQASAAMRRVAHGDLAHRLDVRGPRELADAAQAFNNMTERVEALLRNEKELLAGLSHELRTPLTRLRLELALLESTLDPTVLQRLEGEIAELDGLVDEALALSRLQLGEHLLERRPVPLRPLLASVFPEADIQGQGTVDGDPRLLERLFSNLASNAAKYAPGPVHIVVEEGVVRVADEGPGLRPEELAHLFDPFFRSADAGEQRGLGLGLMIVRQIAELHGGGVTARNLDPGLQISVRLAPAPTS